MHPDSATVTDPETEDPEAARADDGAQDAPREPEGEAGEDADVAAELEAELGPSGPPDEDEADPQAVEAGADVDADAASEAPDATGATGATGAEDGDGTKDDDDALEPFEAKLGPGEKKSDEELRAEAMALLFASADPLTTARLRDLLLSPAPVRVRGLLEDLRADLDASPLPIVLRKIANGWRLLSDPEYADVTGRLRKEQKPEKITAAALETLAIIAYRQPVTKAEIEAIRGVQSGAMLRTLVDRGLVRVTGRASLPGSPLQYGTTKEFLERFGIPSLKELPRDGELTEN